MFETVWVASEGWVRWTAMVVLRGAMREALERWGLWGWLPAFPGLRETLEWEAIQRVQLECSQEAALLSGPAAPVYRDSY